MQNTSLVNFWCWELILMRRCNFQLKTLINEPRILAISNKEDFRGIALSRILFWVWNLDGRQLMLTSRLWQDLVLFGPNSDLGKEINQWASMSSQYYTRSTRYYWKSWMSSGLNIIFTWDWENFSGQESARFEAKCY